MSALASPSGKSTFAGSGASLAGDFTLSADDIERYEHDGAVCLRGAISPRWLGFLRDAAAALEADPGPMAERLVGPTSTYFTDLEMAQRLAPFAEFVARGPCAAFAGALMRSSRACLLYDQARV